MSLKSKKMLQSYSTLTVNFWQQTNTTLNKSFMLCKLLSVSSETWSAIVCVYVCMCFWRKKHVIYMEMEYGKGNVSNIVFSSPRSTYEKAARQKSILAPAAAMSATRRGPRSHQQYGSAEVNLVAAVICLMKLQAVANKALSTPPPSTSTQNYNHTINLKGKTTASRSTSFLPGALPLILH